MNTLEYLGAVKTRLGITSDYALAARLGVTRSAVSNFMRGKGVMGDDVALTVAQVLDVNPLVVIAQANAERASTPEMKARWSGVVEKFSASFNALLSGSRQGRERRLAVR